MIPSFFKIKITNKYSFVVFQEFFCYLQETNLMVQYFNDFLSIMISSQISVLGGAQVVTESSSQMSQFAVLEHKQTKHEIYQEEQTTQAPVFTSSMKSIEVKEGQRAHFECRIIPVSDPTLKVEWLHNGQPLKQGKVQWVITVWLRCEMMIGEAKCFKTSTCVKRVEIY